MCFDCGCSFVLGERYKLNLPFQCNLCHNTHTITEIHFHSIAKLDR